MFSARAASRSSRSPSSPSPWKLYGELRGLNAPPRKIFAPARRTAAAVARTCCSVSAEHGPAMTIDLVAADADVADRDDRGLRLERAAGQLVRLGDAHHLVHAVQHLDQPRVGPSLPDGAEHRARSRRSTGARPCPSRPAAPRRARSAPRWRVLLHHDNHDFEPLAFRLSCATSGRRRSRRARRAARAAALRR